MSELQALLSLSGIGKRYPGVEALSGVTLELFAGEVHALVGENGAGKSTLARIVSGLEAPSSGSMFFKDSAYSPGGKFEAEEAGVRMVMQELNLIPTLSVAENIFFNRLPSSLGLVDRKRLLIQARAVMDRVGLDGVDPCVPVASLGVGQQQMVEIAAGLAQRCELLIMDEPTAALTDSEIRTLFEQIRALKAEGVCIVYISHRMEEISRISDRVTVLRDGVLRGTRCTSEITTDEIIRLMVGKDLGDLHPATSREPGRCLLRVENLCSADRVRNVSFELHGGEILGFAGMMGSGRTELVRLIFGADRMDSGNIYLDESSTAADIRSPRDAVRMGIALLTENRKAQGLLMPQPVSVNTTLAGLDRVSRFGWIGSSKERAAAEKLASRLSLKCRSVRQAVETLSGGNQQKVVMAKWLHHDPKILIFDEPTRGIDVGAKFEIYRLLAALAEEGRAIVVVSSDMLELFAVSDRIAVMSNGVLAEIFERGDWSQDKIMEAALSEYAGSGARAVAGRRH